MRRHARRCLARVIGATVATAAGLRMVNALHRRLSLRARQRFFHLAFDETRRVAGDWRVEFAGRELVLPLRRDFALGWTAAIAFHGYDPELHELYGALVRSAAPPRVFFDVGASYGMHSLRLLAHGVRVVSFEPNPECHDFFRDCCRANYVTPEIVAVAVGAEEGWARLVVPHGRTYLGSIVPEVGERWGGRVATFAVPLITLDRFAAARALVPDLVKIDVEGGELDVLRGARRLLAEARPTVLFESWPRSSERQELFALLTALGYAVHEPAGEGPGSPLSCEAFLGARASNFMARPARAAATCATAPGGRARARRGAPTLP
jgi:FkbM family methyltransferase